MFVLGFLFILLLSVSGQTPDYRELRKMLSHKNLQSWLYNETATRKVNNNRYCNLCCIKIESQIIGKKCGAHTLCKYPVTNNLHCLKRKVALFRCLFQAHQTGPACKGYIQIAFTHNEQQAILDAHNTLRNLVAKGDEKRGAPEPQPAAANMRAVEWNYELAAVAERWAAQCIYANDICRDLGRNFRIKRFD